MGQPKHAEAKLWSKSEQPHVGEVAQKVGDRIGTGLPILPSPQADPPPFWTDMATLPPLCYIPPCPHSTLLQPLCCSAPASVVAADQCWASCRHHNHLCCRNVLYNANTCLQPPMSSFHRHYRTMRSTVQIYVQVRDRGLGLSE